MRGATFRILTLQSDLSPLTVAFHCFVHVPRTSCDVVSEVQARSIVSVFRRRRRFRCLQLGPEWFIRS